MEYYDEMEAVRLIGNPCPKKRRKFLKQMLEHESASMRYTAAESLGMLGYNGDGKALAILAERLPHEKNRDVISMFKAYLDEFQKTLDLGEDICPVEGCKRLLLSNERIS